MVPRPGSTTPEGDVTTRQEPEARAPPIERSSTGSETEERPPASWSSEGTFTTGHVASDELEAYEQQFAVPDVASQEATTGLESHRGPTGLKPERADDQQTGRKSVKTEGQQPPAPKSVVKRRSNNYKKKLRAPDSADEGTAKSQGKDARREYTAAEMDYALSRVELFRQLERHPVLDFLKPKLIDRLTGPYTPPVIAELTSVRLAAQALFKILRDSGFVLGAFEMEEVFDWDLDSWKHAIRVILDPLTILVGTIKPDVGSTPDLKNEERAQSAPLPAPYPSSVDSDSSVESPKRMQMSRPLPTKPPAPKRDSRPSIEERPAAAAAARPVPTRQAEVPAEGAIPRGIRRGSAGKLRLL
jgi:hypothetical protein